CRALFPPAPRRSGRGSSPHPRTSSPGCASSPPSASSCRDRRDRSCPRSRAAFCARICFWPSRVLIVSNHLVPMTRSERVTSPLPRECSTTELHGRILGLPSEAAGAGEGNRTLVISLEGFCSTIELHPPGSSCRLRGLLVACSPARLLLPPPRR